MGGGRSGPQGQVSQFADSPSCLAAATFQPCRYLHQLAFAFTDRCHRRADYIVSGWWSQGAANAIVTILPSKERHREFIHQISKAI
ncbi:hypothetical protein N7449_011237 [Penicillium cf. viridicatum]|uniref:Uncharacterized protein n=1 Tax=Penicillium cf. viridicatum TaxID=2972119 RepID=A0A9W9M2F5_9EURO|nr:hypothetical protein N7449_011237 [Penicillium cf. viridicatum]